MVTSSNLDTTLHHPAATAICGAATRECYDLAKANHGAADWRLRARKADAPPGFELCLTA
jgi:hypothetical protein